MQLLHLLLFVRVRWATSEMSDFDLCIDLMLKYDVTVTTSPQESRQVESFKWYAINYTVVGTKRFAQALENYFAVVLMHLA